MFFLLEKIGINGVINPFVSTFSMMMMQMGMKPSQKKINQMMSAMNKGMK
ncbi:hypothetical protein D0469_07115 [Peribacillus saganii]|uniref:Uncharacterized protein n=1 Tax=Peribacillus saganii TaxID=2303992 RepID=A0A372LS40_9BACI|nr:YneF family protein [Peribacillus saganii]RFU70364.1 hypothetical protein D0469_07115 [Peribacillus saganii]